MSRLVIVSNRLPWSVKKVDGKLEYFPSVGGLSSALASYTERGKNRWIGWPGIPSDELSEDDKADITRYLHKRSCYPIFLTQKQLDGFYNGYSNGVLWPIFHHLPVGDGESEKNWKAYEQVNRLYTDETLRLSNSNDSIWVHDYQLMLLPEMLRVSRPKERIGFFLHIPFPTHRHLKQTPHMAALLRGVLGADLVGVHTTAYAENFLDCCQHEHIGVIAHRKVALPNRVVRVLDFPIGINYDRFADAAKSVEVQIEYQRLRWKYRGKKVILTIDRLDPTKGLVERLEAYRTLLAENPDMHTKVIMVMQAMPSRTEIAAYKKLRQTVDSLIDDINATYGTASWQPVEPIFSALPFEQFAALYQRANVAFIAPIRDGMNLVAKEYLASRPKQDGVLVLSETAGAAEELKEAILVDPSRPRSMVRGLKQALTLPPSELRERTGKMQRYLRRHTVDKWANNFLTSLQDQTKKPLLHLTRSFIGAPEKALVADFHQRRKRLILLDYDGTLQPIVNRPEEAAPARTTIAALKRLSEDPRNEVVIISGRDRATLTSWLGGLPITLVAEHGAFIHRPDWKTWHKTLGGSDVWRDEVMELLEYYADLTPGSFVEYKEHTLVWHYRNAATFTAQKNLVLLKRLLRPIAAAQKLRVKEGKMVLEVHHLDISKAHAMQEWLLKSQDFVLILGDDATDEDMFAAAPAGSYTIKVGQGRSLADYRVPNPASVHKLLRKL